MKYKKGQRVWIYDRYTVRLSTIIDKIDYGYRHRPDDLSESQCRTNIEDHIFAYPEDRQKLINKLYDDSYYLQDLAKELENDI
jgi:hypothetical protein